MTVFKKYNGSDWEAIAVGQKGDTGDAGVGIPSGGTTGQVIAKASATDYDTAWVTLDYVDAAGAVSAIKADADWNATDWDTAFSWGDHSTAGYLTSFTETDPTVGSHIKAITTTQVSNWDTAYGWGDHALAGYLTSYTETDTLDSVTGRGATTSNTIRLNDNAQLQFGSDNDLRIYHNGSSSLIEDIGTGDLILRSSNYLYLQSYTGAENYLIAGTNNGVWLYYDNLKKLETVSTGVAVTGVITATGGSSTDWNAAYGWGDHSTAGYVSNNGTATLSALTLTGEIDEQVFALSGTTPSLDPANGTIQTWTLSGNSTPTDSLAEGESILLLVDDGTAYTITWPTMEWIGGSAPTLDTANTNVIELWKVGSTLYGALVGVSS